MVSTTTALSTLPSLKTLVITLFLLPSLTTAACECGYTLNSTTATLYTHLLETDFLHLSSFKSSASPLNGSDWLPQEYTVSSALARGPYGKNASVDNVRLNPLKNAQDWSGEGVNGGEAGLEVFVRKLGEGVKEGGLVGMGELASSRVDMLFGTFRVGMKLSAVSGTCGAFFWVSAGFIPVEPPITGVHVRNTLTLTVRLFVSISTIPKKSTWNSSPNKTISPLIL